LLGAQLISGPHSGGYSSESAAYIGSYPDDYSGTVYIGSYPDGYPSESLLKERSSLTMTAWS